MISFDSFGTVLKKSPSPCFGFAAHSVPRTRTRARTCTKSDRFMHPLSALASLRSRGKRGREREKEREREREREKERERERDHEGDGLQRRARAASPLPFPSRSGVLRKIARAVSRCKVKPKFCSALRASTAVDSPDTKETALPNRSQTFAAAGPHAPE